MMYLDLFRDKPKTASVIVAVSSGSSSRCLAHQRNEQRSHWLVSYSISFSPASTDFDRIELSESICTIVGRKGMLLGEMNRLTFFVVMCFQFLCIGVTAHKWFGDGLLAASLCGGKILFIVIFLVLENCESPQNRLVLDLNIFIKIEVVVVVVPIFKSKESKAENYRPISFQKLQRYLKKLFMTDYLNS